MFKPNSIKELYIEFGSLAILYPFISQDLLELEGVLLGLNEDTNAPIIYDYRLRDNYNIVILASSGAGKSVTAKLFLHRLLMKEKNLYLYIIDPQGEYEPLAELYQADVLRLTEYEHLGLDPYHLFAREAVADIIADIANADNIARKEIRANAMEADNIFALYDKLEYAKRYMQDLIREPLASLFKGSSKLSNRNILSLRGTYGEEGASMLLILALARAWKDITSIDVSTPKVLLIDEGWMLFNMASTARFINLLARVGRKLNCIMLFITQRPEDVVENEYGRALLDNADTKLILRNTEVASRKLADALSLSDEEVNYITTANRGEALMLVKNMKLKARIIPSLDELRLFSTTPFDR
jgi:DNA helicase HerA-like ATPase